MLINMFTYCMQIHHLDMNGCAGSFSFKKENISFLEVK
jgi:hypothetical protein